MHIIIGVITAIAGLFWALNSLQNSGVDLNSFNPFTFIRRRRWEKLYGVKPLYNLEKPMEAAAALIVGLLKQEGEISREQKLEVIRVFEHDFHLDAAKAKEAFGSSVFLVKDEVNFEQSVKNILAPSKNAFNAEQIESLLSILNRVASIEGNPSEAQLRTIKAVETELSNSPKPSKAWGAS